MEEAAGESLYYLYQSPLLLPLLQHAGAEARMLATLQDASQDGSTCAVQRVRGLTLRCLKLQLLVYEALSF